MAPPVAVVAQGPAVATVAPAVEAVAPLRLHQPTVAVRDCLPRQEHVHLCGVWHLHLVAFLPHLNVGLT